jgi:hypothetical protein
VKVKYLFKIIRIDGLYYLGRKKKRKSSLKMTQNYLELITSMLIKARKILNKTNYATYKYKKK